MPIRVLTLKYLHDMLLKGASFPASIPTNPCKPMEYITLQWQPKSNIYKHIQICEKIWNPVIFTHNQGVAGSSPAGPTIERNSRIITMWLFCFI